MDGGAKFGHLLAAFCFGSFFAGSTWGTKGDLFIEFIQLYVVVIWSSSVV